VQHGKLQYVKHRLMQKRYSTLTHGERFL